MEKTQKEKKDKKDKKEDPDEDSSEGEEEEEESQSFSVNKVLLDKYKAASKISNDVLKYVIGLCVPDADIADICMKGDKKIEEEMGKIYNSKKSKVQEKGIAFPTCVSVNEICGHFSPLKDESQKLKAGDVAKIDLGCHVDGYIAQVAHTIVVGDEKKITGKRAETIVSARNCYEAALRLFKEGNTNVQITKMIAKINEIYKTNALEGVLSHRVKKHMIDGNDVVINKETSDQKVEERKFEKDDVFVLDVIVR